eukprot:Nitzschia sp. Nitz4//scaffold162_size51285//1383//2994//NITZ4_006962-RA/size51285-augustus-gene-0.16-mRNA-1//1//CDS//3329537952//2835//frame0
MHVQLLRLDHHYSLKETRNQPLTHFPSIQKNYTTFNRVRPPALSFTTTITTRGPSMSLQGLTVLETDAFRFSQEDEGLHARLRYAEIASAGPPARPLDFPAPTVYRCTMQNLEARDHRSGTIHWLRHVILRTENAKTAYLVKKKLAKTVYGSIRLCIVLKRRTPTTTSASKSGQDSHDCSDEAIWESTDDLVVIKISEFSRIHAMRGRHLEDPIREISAMQLLGNYHPNVLGAIEVLQDDTCLYTVARYLSGGELCARLPECYPRKMGKERKGGTLVYDESKARGWFRELLQALYHYQKKGVAHRDISLDNILLDDYDRAVLIDPGMGLRVPYSDPCNPGRVSDVSSGTSRRLMISQGQGGKHMYAAPEVVEGAEAVDPFAVDLWAAGVVLFVMLVGLAPFKWAHPSDLRFAQVSRGGLRELITSLDIPMSPEAMDLLQGFFWKDPQKRWTLAEVMEHPWVQGIQFKNVSIAASNSRWQMFSNTIDRKKCDAAVPQFSCPTRMVT